MPTTPSPRNTSIWNAAASRRQRWGSLIVTWWKRLRRAFARPCDQDRRRRLRQRRCPGPAPTRRVHEPAGRRSRRAFGRRRAPVVRRRGRAGKRPFDAAGRGPVGLHRVERGSGARARGRRGAARGVGHARRRRAAVRRGARSRAVRRATSRCPSSSSASSTSTTSRQARWRAPPPARGLDSLKRGPRCATPAPPRSRSSAACSSSPGRRLCRASRDRRGPRAAAPLRRPK